MSCEPLPLQYFDFSHAFSHSSINTLVLSFYSHRCLTLAPSPSISLHFSPFLLLFLPLPPFLPSFLPSFLVHYLPQADGVGTLSALQHLVQGLASRTTDVVVKVRQPLLPTLPYLALRSLSLTVFLSL
jgi:hypothetical protein